MYVCMYVLVCMVALLIAPPLQKQELPRVPARVVSPDQPNPADRVLLVVGAPITAASYDIIEQCIRTWTSANGNGWATALGGVPTKFSLSSSLSSRQPGFQPSDCSITPLATLVTERRNPRLNDTQSAILLATKCLQAKPGSRTPNCGVRLFRRFHAMWTSSGCVKCAF